MLDASTVRAPTIPEETAVSESAVLTATEPATARRTGRAAPITAGALLIVGAVLRAVFLGWHPPLDLDYHDYDAVVPWRESWLPMHALVGAPGFVLAFTGLAACTTVLCSRRAGLLAVIGGLIAAVGAVSFAFGLAAEGLVWRLLLDPAVVDPVTADTVLGGIGAGPQLTTPVLVLASAVVMPVGVLLQLIALAVARTVPLWVPIATVAVLLLGLVPVPGLVPVALVLETAALALIAVLALRHGIRRA
jgi:hypothetical protein